MVIVSSSYLIEQWKYRESKMMDIEKERRSNLRKFLNSEKKEVNKEQIWKDQTIRKIKMREECQQTV
jgi:hypothetical protein